MPTEPKKLEGGKTYKKGESVVDPAGNVGTIGFDTKNGKPLSEGGSTTIPSDVKNQSGIIQTTTSLSSKDNKNTSKIEDIVNNSGTDTSSYNYGDRVIIDGKDVGSAKFNDKTGEALTPSPTVESRTGDNNTSKYYDSPPEGFDYQLPTLAEGKRYVYGSDGRPYVQDTKTGAVTSDSTADSEFQANKTAKVDKEARDSLYDAMKSNLDASHQLLIDSIKAKGEAQKRKQEEINKKTLALKKVQGYRYGGAEFTPEINTGIIKDEIQQGEDRIKEIDANIELTIAQAVQAKDTKDLALLEKRMNTYDELIKAKQDSIQVLYKNYIDYEKSLEDQLKALNTESRAQADQALQELTVQAPELLKEYDSLKTDAEKSAYVDIVAKNTGLATATILGQLEKTRQEKKNSDSIIKNREKQKSTSTSTSEKKKNLEEKQTQIFDSNPTFVDSKGVTKNILDTNGYAEPEAFQYFLRTSGLSRADFLLKFGDYIYLPNIDQYGLLPVEVRKYITGKLPPDKTTKGDVLE